jgi:hypothetical protein
MAKKQGLAVRSKIVSSIAVLAAFFGPFAYAPSFAQTSAPASTLSQALLKPSPSPADTIPIPPARGTLYRVTRDGNTAYLFGTIHIGLPSFYPLEPRVTEALAKASKLAVELDVRDSGAFQSALQKHGFYRDGETLSDHLSADTLAQLRKALPEYGMTPEQVVRMKPWLVANYLQALDLERHGYQRSEGIEFYLLSAAQAQTKPVFELESAELQLALFDGMPPQEQEQYLRESLRDLADGNALKKTKELIKAWSSADDKLYQNIVRESLNDKTLASEFTRRVLLDKRNPQMATKIEALLQQDKNVFVGIGLLHLLGEASVPALLQQRGYRVEKLY